MLTAKRFPISLLLCLAVSSSASGGTTLSINAPDGNVAVGQMLVIPIEGSAPEWYHEFAASCFPREGAQCIVGRTMPGKPDDPGRPFLAVRLTLPGEYRLAVATKDAGGKLVTAEAFLTVEGEPQPDPNPTPVPVPPGPRSMVVIVETGTRTAKEASMLGAVRAYARTSGRTVRIVDQDVVDGSTGKTPDWLLPYLSALGKHKVKVPALVVALVLAPESTGSSPESSVVTVKALGGLSGADAVKLMTKWGG